MTVGDLAASADQNAPEWQVAAEVLMPIGAPDRCSLVACE
jgi:hypothetical protein